MASRPAPAPSDCESPCTGVCTLDLVTTICFGCGRTLEEIEWWTRYSEAQRAEVCARLPARLAALEQARAEEPQKGPDTAP